MLTPRRATLSCASLQSKEDMAQEIELKFIVNPPVINALSEKLSGLSQEQHEASRLVNIYYETPDNFLRRHNMGLRIRGNGNRYEMTMKTSGQVTGGLHQRPEYNVPLSEPTLDLALLPAEIWPQGVDIAELQQQLNPLFSTNFNRQTWIVQQGMSRIELALDQGEVVAGDLQEPICELELELLEGEASALLILAEQLVNEPGLRMGSLSKAARGYHLAQGAVERSIKPLSLLSLAPKTTIEQALKASLAQSLESWLYHEELWLRGNRAARQHILLAAGNVRHVLALFGGIIPRKASSQLRDLLLSFEASLAEHDKGESVLFSAQASITKLTLTRWLFESQWRDYVDEKGRTKLDGSLKRFADGHLSRHSAELRAIFQRPLGDAYAEKLTRLVRELDAARLLAGIYRAEQASPWLENWQGLFDAISTNQIVEIEHYRNEAISQAPFWLHSGK